MQTILHHPMWKILLALYGLLWGIALIITFLGYLIIWALDEPFSFPIAFVSNFFACTALFIILWAFLDRRFFNVRPSAAIAFPGDAGPWLSWPADPSTGIIINWITASKSPGIVEFGHSPESFHRIEGSLDCAHHLEIRDLAPGTTYHYRIPHFGEKLKVYSFRTAPSSSQMQNVCRFVVVGDTQNGGGQVTADWALPHLMDVIKTHQFDFILNVGDFTDQGNDMGSWLVALRTITRVAANKPFQIAVGNHDTGTHYMKDPTKPKKFWDEGANFDYILGYKYETPSTENEITPFKGRYYTRRFAHCVFFFVDTQNSKMAEPNNPQWSWLDRELEAVPAGLWKIIVVHRDLVSVKARRGKNYNYDYDKFAAFIVPILAKHHVDLVFQGHDHTLNVMRWDFGPDLLTLPDDRTIMDTDPRFAPKFKPIWFITSGGAGNELRENPGIHAKDVDVQGFQYFEDTSHFLLVNISEDFCTIEARDAQNQIRYSLEIPRNQ
jgi:hypothetical protein